jgi:hypothetical protein
MAPIDRLVADYRAIAARTGETPAQVAGRHCECDDEDPDECSGPLYGVEGAKLPGGATCPCPCHPSDVVDRTGNNGAPPSVVS